VCEIRHIPDELLCIITTGKDFWNLLFLIMNVDAQMAERRREVARMAAVAWVG
jgi:hypothetical protein